MVALLVSSIITLTCVELCTYLTSMSCSCLIWDVILEDYAFVSRIL